MVWLTLKDKYQAGNRMRIGPFGKIEISANSIYDGEGGDEICRLVGKKWQLMVVAKSWESTFEFDELIVD